MIVDVVLWAGDASGEKVAGKDAAVIDVFRATSVIVEAMKNGAEAVIPVETVREAVDTAERLGRDGILLAGERDTVMIEGFDLDNSPLKFTENAVKGKTIVQTTTNGTRAIRNSRQAASLYIASFLNYSAVCEKLASPGRDIVIVCSGREDEYTAEDGLCAGAMAGQLAEKYGYALTDIAGVMAEIYVSAQDDLRGRLSSTRHYRHILGRGYNDDIEFCLQRDIYGIVPCYHAGGYIHLECNP